MNNKNGDALTTVGVFLLGIVSGVLITAFISMDPKSMRRMMEKRKRKFREMWGDFTDEERKVSQEIKNKVMDKITDLNLSLEDIDKKQYIKIVQDAIREVQKKLSLPDNLTEKMQSFWERNYERVRRELET